MDEESLRKWQQLQHYKSIVSQKNGQGMTNNVWLTFSGGDFILWFTISIEQDNYSWWHEFSVVSMHTEEHMI